MTDGQRESGMDGSPEPILPEHFASRRELREARGLTPHRHPLIRRIVAIVAVLAAVAVAGGVYAYWRLNANITQVDVTSALGTNRPSVAAAASGSTGPLNILLIGSDTREGDGNGGFGDGSWEPGAHSDTTLLMHLSGDRKSVEVVSIPRDSMTPAPPECSPDAPREEWVTRQWNQNFTLGGPGCLIRTLEGNTDLRVDHYAIVDFRGFKNMVDALGGVPVCTQEAIDDEKANLHLAPGRHVLNGKQALGYVRVRYTVGDGSDLGRIKRQQAFLSSVAQEATKSSLLLRPDKLYAFLSAATKSLTTDPEFGVGTMQDVAASVKNIGVDEIRFVTVPNEQYPADPNRVQWKASADLLWDDLRNDREVGKTATPTATPTASASAAALTVSPSKISVTILNGSGTEGLATQDAEALRVQGFAAVTTGANVTGAATGVLVEYSGTQGEAARTVAAAFPGAKTKKVDGLGEVVRVTLGPKASNVVEVPNRLGSTPIPTPSITAGVPAPGETIEVRTADDDICS